MDHSTRGEEGPFFEDGFILDLGSLYARFEALEDQRHDRGKRYPLALVLALVVLAKLAGEDHPDGIAQWARARAGSLREVLSFRRQSMPCANTYRRVLSALDCGEFEEMVRQFLQAQPGAGQSVLISLDGKTLRGTIPTGSSQGVHLLSAYMPAEGLVLLQVAVESKENEISAAPRLLAALDLRGKIVAGDAMFTQRTLSLQIVDGGGDYIWFVKDNHAEMREAIETLFGDPLGVPDGQEAHHVDKGHGRLETRRLVTSQLLKGYLAWPHLEQVFKIERQVKDSKGQVLHAETVYGLTSLRRQEADAQALLGYTRGYWGIENGLHYRRDKTFREDAMRTANPTLAQIMAAINNLAIGLLSRQKWPTLSQARRYYSAHLDQAVALILRAPT